MIHSGIVQFHEDLGPMLVDIDSVRQHPENYNNGDIDAIAESIEINGVYRPVFVQRSTGYIVAGNHTWEACKSLGSNQIPVVYLDVDDTEALRITIADNETARLARPDNARLLDQLRQLEESGGLFGTGYNEGRLEALALQVIRDNETPIGGFAQEQGSEFDHNCPVCGHGFND